jgi:hypothetical protein
MPFMLQRFAGSEASSYSYYLKRWLVWYAAVLVLGLVLSFPMRVCMSFMPAAICGLFNSLTYSVVRIIQLVVLPFIVVHHVQSSTGFRGMFYSFWYSSWLLFLELPMVSVVGLSVFFIFLVQQKIVGLIGGVIPYGGTLFSLYVKVLLLQAIWSLLLSLYSHREGEHSEAEMVIKKEEPAAKAGEEASEEAPDKAEEKAKESNPEKKEE